MRIVRPLLLVWVGGGSVSLAAVVLTAGCLWARAPRAAQPARAAPRAAVLVLKEPAGLARTRWPITAGVPFPQGQVRDVSAVALTEGLASTPVQARVLGRWPDGSARWVLLDWQADLQPRQERRYHIGFSGSGSGGRVRGDAGSIRHEGDSGRREAGTGSRRPEGGTATPGTKDRRPVQLRLAETGGRIEVNTGPLQFAIPKTRFAILENVRLNGAPLTGGPAVSFLNVDGTRIEARAPATVKVTEAGPLRARIELRGDYGAGFRYVVRIDAFAHQPFVRVLHSVEHHGAAPYTLVGQIGIDLPLALTGPAAYRVGVEGGAPVSGVLAPGGLAVVQEDNEAFRLGSGGATAARRPGHADGWVDVHDAARGVAVIARYFWQEYPQSLQLWPGRLTYNMWAPEARPAQIGMGAAKTHELVVLFHDQTGPAPPAPAALREPLLARVDPHWIVSTRALRNSIAPSAATGAFLRELGAGYARSQRRADTERWDDSGQVPCPGPEAPAASRPRRGAYGMFNWGDWNFPGYHDTTKGCDAWGNLEYDLTQVLALAYAATGERAYYDGMVAAARHFTDVDHIYSHHDRPSFVGMNHPKNPLHFTFELGGVDLGHTWTEGLLSYYHLTGDERSLDAARGIAEYLVRRLRGGATRGNPRQFGWPQIALVAMYEATADARYKTAAIDYARRGMRLHPPARVAEWKMGILAEGVAYTHSLTGDAAMRDWLLRYAAAVTAGAGRADPRYFPAVAYAGRLAPERAYARAASASAGRLKFGNWAKPFTIAGRTGFALLSP